MQLATRRKRIKKKQDKKKLNNFAKVQIQKLGLSKGRELLDMVIEMRVQYCRTNFQDSFETFLRCIIVQQSAKPILKITSPKCTIQCDFKDWTCAFVERLHRKKVSNFSWNISSTILHSQLNLYISSRSLPKSNTQYCLSCERVYKNLKRI